MAEDKSSILVYADWIHKFEELEDDEAGRLIKHFFRYVNDLNPEYPDRTTKLMFIDIKNTLKRDLYKWESKSPTRVEKARKAGLASAEARRLKKELNSTNELEFQLGSTKSTVSVSVSVSDICIVNEKDFLGMFNKCRKHFDKIETEIEFLKEDEKKEFLLTANFDKTYFENSLTGFYKQKNIFAQLRIRPLHFLKNIELYNECYFSKKQLYPEPIKKTERL